MLFRSNQPGKALGSCRIATMVQLGLDSVLSSTEHLGSMAKTKARHPPLTPGLGHPPACRRSGRRIAVLTMMAACGQ